MNNLSQLNNWERQKAIFILHQAEQFGFETSKHTQIGVNPNSGNTWVWDEFWSVCLYMPINCELRMRDVWVCWTNPEDGEEHEESLFSFQSKRHLDKWVAQLEKTLYQD